MSALNSVPIMFFIIFSWNTRKKWTGIYLIHDGDMNNQEINTENFHFDKNSFRYFFYLFKMKICCSIFCMPLVICFNKNTYSFVLLSFWFSFNYCIKFISVIVLNFHAKENISLFKISAILSNVLDNLTGIYLFFFVL